MTIDQKTVEIEVNELGRSLCVVQIRSTKGESEGLSIKGGTIYPVQLLFVTLLYRDLSEGWVKSDFGCHEAI
jgi:hypothetical protein